MNCAGKSLLLILACSTLVAAGNPFIGTWKENIDKSFYSDGSAEHSAVISIASAGDKRVKIIQEIVNAAGKRNRTVEEYPLNGTAIHPSDQDPNFTRSFRSINPNVWERILKDAGEIRDGYWAVSSDGKMLIITGFGKDSSGKAYYF